MAKNYNTGRKPGRPSKAQKKKTDKEKCLHKLNYIATLKSNGMTNAQIARKLDIGEDSFYKVKKSEPRIQEALERGNQMLLEKIETSMYTRMLFGDKKVKKRYEIIDGKKVQTEEVEDFVPVAHQLQQFALRNLMPEKYNKDKQLDLHVSDDSDKDTKAASAINNLLDYINSDDDA